MRIQACSWLIQKQHLGPGQQAYRDIETPPHSAGVGIDTSISELGDRELV